MGEKADWSAAHVKLFCELCANEVLAGHRPLGHLNKVGWKNVEAKFLEESGRKLEHLQFKNKWDNLKRNYSIFMELKNAATGLGWNETRQTVDCDDKWWEEHLAKCHDPPNGRKCKHVQFKKYGPANLESLHIMFGSAHVTGASATIPGDFSANSTDDDVQEIQRSITNANLNMRNQNDKKRKASSSASVEDKEDKSSPFLRLYKQACSKIEEGVDKISTSIEASSKSTTSHVPTIAEAMKMVKECGVQEGTALLLTASLVMVKPEFRELLATFETLRGRLDWLQRQHEMQQLP